MSISIRDATAADVQPITTLLRDADLVLDDVSEHVHSFIVAEHDGELTGAMGLELRGGDALLRSAVVVPAARGAGVGRELFERMQSVAREHGVGTLYLLTTTARSYWTHLGFTPIAREEVPAAVRESVEFRGACPASATAMSFVLDTTV